MTNANQVKMGTEITESTEPPIIQVVNLGKKYRIYERPQDRLKQFLFWRFGRQYGSDFWALRGLSFDVRRGETIGVIGRNGSGKSTLLQIIAGTLAPTEGHVSITGRIAALLELGSGFNPEYTGRENVFLNGSILGLSNQEIEQRYAEIVEFADIGEFIDQPVKIYSSGMVVRLAFAVSACIEPEILIVDEALAVGDMYFQAKCMARIERLRRNGTTILVVSHSAQTIRSICDRALYLEDGQLIEFGDVEHVVDLYSSRHIYQGKQLEAIDHTSTAQIAESKVQPAFEQRVTERTGSGEARYRECIVISRGNESESVLHGEYCEVHAWLEHYTATSSTGEVGILVRDLNGLDLFAVNSYFLDTPYPQQPGGALVRVVFRFKVTLAPGTYSIVLGLRLPVQGEYADKVYNAAIFRVITRDGGYIPGLFSAAEPSVLFSLPKA